METEEGDSPRRKKSPSKKSKKGREKSDTEADPDPDPADPDNPEVEAEVEVDEEDDADGADDKAETEAADGDGDANAKNPDGTPKKKTKKKKKKKPEKCLSAVAPADAPDESCKTFIFKHEGHTLGNALRYVISQYPETKFCGHTIPHPSEDEMHLRIQTIPDVTAVEVLKRGLHDLIQVCEHTETTFQEVFDAWEKENPQPIIQVEDDGFQVPPPRTPTSKPTTPTATTPTSKPSTPSSTTSTPTKHTS